MYSLFVEMDIYKKYRNIQTQTELDEKGRKPKNQYNQNS